MAMLGPDDRQLSVSRGVLLEKLRLLLHKADV